MFLQGLLLIFYYTHRYISVVHTLVQPTNNRTGGLFLGKNRTPKNVVKGRVGQTGRCIYNAQRMDMKGPPFWRRKGQ